METTDGKSVAIYSRRVFRFFRKRDDDWSDSNVRIVDVQRCRAGEKHDGDYVVQLVI